MPPPRLYKKKPISPKRQRSRKKPAGRQVTPISAEEQRKRQVKSKKKKA